MSKAVRFHRTGGPPPVGVTLPRKLFIVARGSQENRWVGDDTYAFERVVAGQGAAGLIVLNDRLNSEVRFGDGNGSFIVRGQPWTLSACVFPQQCAIWPPVSEALPEAERLLKNMAFALIHWWGRINRLSDSEILAVTRPAGSTN